MISNWLHHCGCWFGFSEPAKFAQHKDGGYFVSVTTGEEIKSIAQNGFWNPERGSNPWMISQ